MKKLAKKNMVAGGGSPRGGFVEACGREVCWCRGMDWEVRLRSGQFIASTYLTGTASFGGAGDLGERVWVDWLGMMT